MTQALIQELTPSRRHHAKHDVGGLDGFPFQLQAPDNTDYVLGYDWVYGGKISQLRITASLGAGTVSVLINGNKVTGLDTVPVNANARSQHNADDLNSFQPGDDIVLRIESGAGSLVNVRGTLVVTNKAIFVRQISPATWLVPIEFAIDSTMAGQSIIPVSIVPQLRRNPVWISPIKITKNSPTEDDVFYVNDEPFEPNDWTNGWNYVLSGSAVLGQIVRGVYVP